MTASVHRIARAGPVDGGDEAVSGGVYGKVPRPEDPPARTIAAIRRRSRRTDHSVRKLILPLVSSTA